MSSIGVGDDVRSAGEDVARKEEEGEREREEIRRAHGQEEEMKGLQQEEGGLGTGDISLPSLDHVNGEPDGAQEGQEPQVTVVAGAEGRSVGEDDEEEEKDNEPEDDGDLGMSQSQIQRPSASSKEHATNGQTQPRAEESVGKRGHSRIDSVPPQKYNLDSSPTRQFSTTKMQRGMREEPLREEEGGTSSYENEYDGDSDGYAHEDDDNDQDDLAGPSSLRRGRSEIEEAGLDFVDIRLDMDAAEHGPFPSPYGAGGAGMRGASKSAVEIRQDSISSGSRAAKDVAKAAKERERTKGELLPANGHASGSHAPGPSSSNVSLHTRPGARPSVEGRYRGRRSVSPSPSRAASPEPAATRTMQSSVDQGQALRSPSADRKGSLGVITMTVVNADGELEVIETPLSPSSKSSFSEVNLEGSSKEESNDTSLQKRPPIPPSVPEEEEGKISASAPNADQANQKGNENHEKSAPVEQPDSPSKGKQRSTDQEEKSEQMQKPNDEMSPGLKDIADEEVKTSRRRSKPSALEQHVSRTRMTTLPPKTKEEDVRHLSDFEAMMKSYREAEKKRALEEEERRIKKDEMLSDAMHIWEREILPSWTRARREHRLRQVWWRGAPPNLRGRVWALACGNAQMLPRNLFVQAGNAARKAQQDGVFPEADMRALEADIEATLPSLKLFQSQGPLYQDLKDVLCAFVMYRLDSIGGAEVAAGASPKEHNDDGSVKVYQRGSASLAAMLLTNLSPNETLIALINLIADRPWLKALYALPPSTDLDPLAAGGHANDQPHIHNSAPRTPSRRNDAASGFERVFDTLLADQMPKVYANMQAHGVRPSAYVRDWVRTLFVPFLSLEAVARLWDCILLEESGENGLIFRTGIALVSLLSARLYVPEKRELITILRGNNRAALSVWHRQRALMSGTTFAEVSSPGSVDAPRSIEADADMVPKDDVYGGQYGITEHSLFQALEEQQSWWKDSMLERLLDRELVNV